MTWDNSFTLGGIAPRFPGRFEKIAPLLVLDRIGLLPIFGEFTKNVTRVGASGELLVNSY